MNGPVLHPTFWSTLVELVGIIVLPVLIYKWPHKTKVKSVPLDDAPNPREERAGYVEAKLERFNKRPQ